MDATNPAAKKIQCFGGERGAELGFKTGDFDSRVMRDGFRIGDALIKRTEAVVVLQGITWRDQPPDLIQLQPGERFEADMPVPRMRRIKRAAEQADTLTRRGRREGDPGQGFHANAVRPNRHRSSIIVRFGPCCIASNNTCLTVQYAASVT